MDLLGWLALIFLTLIGYSVGAVLGWRIKPLRQASGPSPSLIDTLMVVVLWIGAVTSRLTVLERWAAVGVWLAVALCVAFLLRLIQKQPDQGKPISQ